MNNVVNIQDKNLSIVWAKLFEQAMIPGNNVLHPVVVSIVADNKETPEEISSIRLEVDKTLKRHGKPSVDESAATIFPYDLWRLGGKQDCKALSKWYLEKYLPRHVARARIVGCKGHTYFTRMIDFHGLKESNGECTKKSVNQLQHPDF